MVVDAASDDVVRGVVVYVDEDAYDEVLRSLDKLEEYDPENVADSLYQRIATDVELVVDGGAEQTKVRCFTYCGSLDAVRNLPSVVDNDWRAEVRRDSSARAWWSVNHSARTNTAATQQINI